MPPSTLADVTSGHLMALLSNDCQRLRDTLFSIFQVVLGPVVILVCVIMNYILVGPYVLIGLGIMCLTTPITSRLSKKMMIFTIAKLSLADERVRVRGGRSRSRAGCLPLLCPCGVGGGWLQSCTPCGSVR
jgi:hypothetical protein